MQAVFANLTASLLLVQMLTGWCWRCASETHACTADVQVTSHCCCDPTPHETPEAPANCPKECQGVCVYVSPVNVHVDLSLLDADFGLYMVSVELLHEQVASEAYWERNGDNSPSEPPIRLHLMHQLLLI